MERVSSVNAFQIKRQAHAVSRSDAGWNPFRHVWKDHHRSQTWDGNDAEAQRTTNPNDIEGGSPIEHAHTAPSRPFSGMSDEAKFGASPERTVSSGDTVVPSQGNTADTTATDAAGIRNRHKDRDAEETPTEEGKEPVEEKKKRKDHRMFKHVEPKEPFTVANQIQRTLLNSWINILLVAAPVGIVLGAVPNMNEYAVFVVNFIAIIPLAAMLSFATEEIALRTGETLGGLLNASFGYVYAAACMPRCNPNRHVLTN